MVMYHEDANAICINLFDCKTLEKLKDEGIQVLKK
jgi:hypothetical protein